jgi:thiol-disulfide isomerase/thioredoxin
MPVATKGSTWWRSGLYLGAFALVGYAVARLAAPTPAAAPLPAAAPAVVPAAAPVQGGPLAALTPLIGRPAPTTPFYALDDRPHDLAEVHGKPAIVAIFGHDCDHCHEMLPKAQAFFRKHRAEGLAFWAIDGANGNREEVQNFKRLTKLESPLFYDPQAGLADALQVEVFPTFYWLDKDGVIRAQVIGEFLDQDFEALWLKYGRRESLPALESR